MSGLFVPPERVSVRYAATGLIEALAGAEFVHRVRDGRIGATDRVERDDGVFVRWTMDRRFSALAAELGLDTGATGPVPRVTTPSGAPAAVASSPRTAETRITGQSDAVRSSMGRQGATPSGSLRSVGSDPEAALRAARQRMGQTRAVDQTVERIRALQQSSGSAAVASGPASGPHPVALRSVLTADLLSSGPEVVRDILLQTPLTEILGVDAATQGRRLDSIRAQLCNQLESMWPSNSDELRTAESRAARVDALRIVTAAHRVLSAPAERSRHDRIAARLGRPPRFLEVVEFVPTLPSAGSSEEEQISEEDAAVLRYVGFDTRRLRDEARAKQASKTSGGRTAATTAPSPGPSAAAADRQRKQVLALLLVVAFGAALYLGPCAGEETSEDGFRVIDE